MEILSKDQYVFDEDGNATAVIIPIEKYKRFIACLEEIEDRKEAELLSQSPEFEKLVKSSIEDIDLQKASPWKDVWDEL